MQLKRRELLIGSLGAVCGASAASTWWDRKPEEWTPRDIQTVLNDSPWVRRTFLMMDSSAIPNGRAENDKRKLATDFAVLVRWESGLPVRLARKTATLRENREPQHYLISVSRLPLAFVSTLAAKTAQRAAPDEKAVRADVASLVMQSASLDRPGKEAIGAASAVWVDSGFTPELMIAFPRAAQPPIALEDGEVSFSAQIHSLSISARFPLKPMIYRGRLEL